MFPNIPAPLGEKDMIRGVNARFLNAKEKTHFDGEQPKEIKIAGLPAPHFRKRVRHGQGQQVEYMVEWDLYKA